MLHSLRVWLIASVAVLTLFCLPLPSQAQGAPHSVSPFSEYSPAQQAQLKTRNARFVKDVTALRDDKKMTQAQKQAKYQGLKESVEKDMLAILTPAQRLEVSKRKAINMQFESDLAALRTNTTMTEDQKKARFQILMQTRQNALLATLPPGQRALVEKTQQVQMARAALVQKMGEELQRSQSPAQLKQIQAISLATRQQEQAVAEDKTLSNQAKQTRFEELRRQAQAKIDALLTPAQRAKFARMRAMVSAPIGQ